MESNAAERLRDPSIVLFRHDLRLADNRALAAAAASDAPLLCAFVLDEVSPGIRPVGAARRWWLHNSIAALAAALEKIGGRLVLLRGPMEHVVANLIEQTGARTMFWNRRYAPAEAGADLRALEACRRRGVRAEVFDGALLHDPERMRTGADQPYKVFGAFRRALEKLPEPREPVDAPERIIPWTGKVDSDKLDHWRLQPTKPDWAAGLRETWTPGEAGATARLDAFLDERLDDYAEGRDFPAQEATSRLSPHLTHGEITPYQILASLKRLRQSGRSENAAKLRSEIAWREFCYHLLAHLPDMAERNYNADFDGFPWRKDAAKLAGWQRGETGYPIVDAGMRQLWQTGWMHNRIRMVVASFLTKHLLIDWREGEKWFWDTLVDADPANNPANWQWVAGSGADAAPYFRIFNPILQGQKFDSDGRYTRRFVPEIAGLPDKALQEPARASADELENASVKLGRTYPVPLVEHAAARDKALAAYKSMKGTP